MLLGRINTAAETNSLCPSIAVHPRSLKNAHKNKKITPAHKNKVVNQSAFDVLKVSMPGRLPDKKLSFKIIVF